MKKHRTTFILIISTIVMLVSFATLALFFKIIANKNAHTSAILVTLANKMAKKDNIDILTKKIEEVNTTKRRIDGYFVDASKIDSFIEYLENLGTSAGTEIKVAGFEVSPTDPHLLLVRLTSKGSFTNTMRTIMLLENAPYQLRITRTSLVRQTGTMTDAKGKASTTSFWQAEISFSILTS